ncbi:MAG: prolipoprotein diacylglyceryl transferase [Eubacterium sp.]|nr:prolipoprotein diacylglyceryl transferase [Eubacterium sp.]
MNTADVAFPHLGIYIGNLPKNFSVFGITIAFYGVIIAIGMLAGLLMACRQAKVTGQKTSVYTDYVVWGIIFSLIGARLYYVIFAWDKYKDNLWSIFNVRNGGLAIYGGVIAAFLSAYIFCRIKKFNFLLFWDTALCGLILGQCIGRWGNFMNQEAFGEYTDSFLAMRLNVANVNANSITDTMRANMQTIDGQSFIQVHPTFLYESLWNLMVLLLMVFYTRHKKFHGEIALLYLVGYGAGRVWIEGLRTDQLQIGSTGIAVSQVLSGVLVVGGIVLWIIFRRRAKGVPSVPEAMRATTSPPTETETDHAATESQTETETDHAATESQTETETDHAATESQTEMETEHVATESPAESPDETVSAE